MHDCRCVLKQSIMKRRQAEGKPKIDIDAEERSKRDAGQVSCLDYLPLLFWEYTNHKIVNPTTRKREQNNLHQR